MDELAVMMSMAKPKKTSGGKKKIDLTKKVIKKSCRLVTFSKRRQGLFKKCDELCDKYGSEIALITFSEAGKCFPYGNPNPDHVLQRYLNSWSGHNNNNNNYYDGGNWWDDVEVDKLGLSELEQLKFELERSLNGVNNQALLETNPRNGVATSSELEQLKFELERSLNEVNNQALLETNPRNGVATSTIDEIKADMPMPMSNLGIGLDDFKYDQIFGGSFNNDDEFDYDFDLSLLVGDLIPDMSILQHLQVN